MELYILSICIPCLFVLVKKAGLINKLKKILLNTKRDINYGLSNVQWYYIKHNKEIKVILSVCIPKPY